MARRHIAKRELEPDPVHKNVMVAKFINQIMREGKKSIARKVVYGAFAIAKERLKKEPLEIFQTAIENVTPLLEVRSRRVGGATYQVPVEVKGARKLSLAFRWILTAARSKKGRPMAEKLADELMAAYKNEGSAVKKREDTHKMAEANRAFAHFAW
ncbi:MAG: 30S ribosomal protein S7 [Candidatus Wildermuthbacteria bacterium]|nr:30S ribosomal protein S7 [Candidatus Wildermuthbacteria bacterium]MBI2121138.1 30S ribosomal protein S7 [Candidatus Wildermuthbacteria bacterium]MBI2647751.1 30S ribosomal protein S7 [Candidatus Wildermuthbacteria bacterium]